MADDKMKASSRGRTQVNIYEEWDVAYWLETLGCTRKQLEKAVTEAGTSAQKVREYIQMQNIPF